MLGQQDNSIITFGSGSCDICLGRRGTIGNDIAAEFSPHRLIQIRSVLNLVAPSGNGAPANDNAAVRYSDRLNDWRRSNKDGEGLGVTEAGNSAVRIVIQFPARFAEEL